MTIDDDLAALFPSPLLLDEEALEAYALMREAETKWLTMAHEMGHHVHHLLAPGTERPRRQTVLVDTGGRLPPSGMMLSTRTAYQANINRLQPLYHAGQRSTAIPAWSTPSGLVPLTDGRPDAPIADSITYRTKTAWRGAFLDLPGCIGYLEKRVKTLQTHAANYRKQYKARRAAEIEARIGTINEGIDKLRQMPAGGLISGRVRSGRAVLFRIISGAESWESSTPNVLLVRGTPETTFSKTTRSRIVESKRELIAVIDTLEIFTGGNP